MDQETMDYITSIGKKRKQYLVVGVEPVVSSKTKMRWKKRLDFNQSSSSSQENANSLNNSVEMQINEYNKNNGDEENENQFNDEYSSVEEDNDDSVQESDDSVEESDNGEEESDNSEEKSDDSEEESDESEEESDDSEEENNYENPVENDNADEQRANENEIIFAESGLIKKELMAMVHVLSLKHKFTQEARQDVINLLKLCANANDITFPTSNYYFEKFFTTEDDTYKYVFYCDKCKSSLTKPLAKKEIKKQKLPCPNEACHTENTISLDKKEYFLTVNFSDQIKQIFDNLKNPESLQLTRREEPNTITDVYDSELYRNIQTKFGANCLTYSFNTDGAPIFTASRCAMWPVQGIINELPPRERFRNIVFMGIWVGYKEPDCNLMNSIMESVVSTAHNLSNEGVTLKNETNYKVLPFTCSVDSKARPIIQNRKQFNGYFGCSWCYHPGVCVNGQIKYPMLPATPLLRTHESYLQDLENTVQNNFESDVRGIYGPSVLMHLPCIDMVWSFPIDYMHGVLLGVTKQMWELWTTYTPESKHKYYIGKQKTLKIISNKLTGIKPPHDIHRLPRSLINDKSKWKANEWRSWLLFYSIPCLKGILKDTYWNHFAKLVKGMFILLKRSITQDQLDDVEMLLTSFVHSFERLYGSQGMTYNMHSLLHLSESVRKTGPIWANSAFPYESGIFLIKQQVKGPVSVAQQITKKIISFNNIKNSINNNNRYSEKVQQFCNHILEGPTQRPQGEKFLGARSIVRSVDILNLCARSNVQPYYSYKRCIFRKQIISSTSYMRESRNNDNFIEITDGSFVQVNSFLVDQNDDKFMLATKVNVQTLKAGELFISHIYKITLGTDQVLLPLHEFKAKCIFIQLDPQQYLCQMPNTLEIQ